MAENQKNSLESHLGRPNTQFDEQYRWCSHLENAAEMAPALPFRPLPSADVWGQTQMTIIYTSFFAENAATKQQAHIILGGRKYGCHMANTVEIYVLGGDKKSVTGKVKFSHMRYQAFGPELIPVCRQSACR